MATRILPEESTYRVVYESPCRLVRVERDGPRDFALYLHGQYTKSYKFQYQAEHDGGVWLEEQARELAVALADEAAEREREPAEEAEGALLLATLAGGECITGIQEPLDGSPAVVTVRNGESYATIDAEGYLDAEWAGVELFDLTPDRLAALIHFFAVTLPAAQLAARRWVAGEQPISEATEGGALTLSAGSVEITIEPNHPACVWIGQHAGIDLPALLAALPGLYLLLSDPRVAAGLSLPLPAAAPTLRRVA
jgi:hypothetical protein